MAKTNLVVNGRPREVDAPAEMPLLWVLRDRLGLTGTKYGCGAGVCGACTVHLDGEAYRSCQVPIGSVAGRRVTTIEALAAEGLKQAWIAEDVSQCGYCQAGQIMQAAALLGKTPNPGDDEIVAALNDNLCRCGTYLRIRAAVRRAAEVEGKHY
jgi:aerobic-type carbon monoxide dehydrogenase small subunit (CoxS/CutS family)